MLTFPKERGRERTVDDEVISDLNRAILSNVLIHLLKNPTDLMKIYVGCFTIFQIKATQRARQK